MNWSCGLMTVAVRKDRLLPFTLASIRAAGFPPPRLFVDGASSGFENVGLPVTYRDPLVRVAGNWFLAMWELYVRSPHADRYILFQDDIVIVKNTREYIERSWPSERAYLNLYTAEGNNVLSRQQTKDGWFVANQLGKGALGLVFDNPGLRALLSAQHMVNRFQDERMGWRSVDGGISESLCRSAQLAKGEPYVEYCHRPSLIQHTGAESVMDKRKHVSHHDPNHPVYVWPNHAAAMDWRPDFDPLTLLTDSV